MYPDPGYTSQAQYLLDVSAQLDDTTKSMAEYWSDGPSSETPPGQWTKLAQWVSLRDSLDPDANVKLFFALSNALLDTSIAVWDCKLALDYVRPITAIRYLFSGAQVSAWGGPGQGRRAMDGQEWLPYQLPSIVSPSFPEYMSGHSAFSAAAAEILARFTGSDQFGALATIGMGTSKIEPRITPAQDLTLSWATFSEAADQAGMSRRYGGIHFETGDLQGRAIGRKVGGLAWTRATSYFAPGAA